MLQNAIPIQYSRDNEKITNKNLKTHTIADVTLLDRENKKSTTPGPRRPIDDIKRRTVSTVNCRLVK